MGLGEKVNRLATNLQDGVKSTSISLTNMVVKILTAFLVGVTIALIAQEMIQYGTLGFVFMMLVVMGLVYKLISTWSLGATLVFDLVCVLVALLLRMYILLAP